MFIAISSVLMGLTALYVVARAVYPLACPAWLRWCLALAVFAAAEKILILRYTLGPTVVQLDLAPALVFGTGFAQGFVVLAALLILTRDAVLLTLWLTRRLRQSKQPPSPPTLPLWRRPAPVLLLALLCTGWGVWEASKVPEVHKVRLKMPTLAEKAPALTGLHIAQLADLHIGAGFDRAWLAAVVARTNALKPDMVVITGDIVDGSVDRLRASVAPLQDLRSRYGTFLVVGNHEYMSNVHAWIQEFQRMGITVLTNSHVVVPVQGTPLVVAGVTDPRASVTGDTPPNPVQALQGRPAPAFTLMLSHQARTAKASAAAGAQLQLSGHTHGGLIWPLRAFVALFNEGFVAGSYTVGGMRLYVHSGSALWAGFPLRLGVPSEIADITLE
ncbi:MAG: metallophosphoesterase [Desulfovibrionaceae bacterium]